MKQIEKMRLDANWSASTYQLEHQKKVNLHENQFEDFWFEFWNLFERISGLDHKDGKPQPQNLPSFIFKY